MFPIHGGLVWAPELRDGGSDVVMERTVLYWFCEHDEHRLREVVLEGVADTVVVSLVRDEPVSSEGRCDIKRSIGDLLSVFAV